MPSSYPGGYDALTNPAGGDDLTSPSHSGQHTDANNAIEAIQAELGLDPAGAQATVKARLDTMAVSSIGAILDGAGAAIADGTKVYVRVPFACTINEFTLLADQSGSITVEVWKDTYANYPPLTADDISNNGLAISAADKATDTTLTSWTTAIAAGDVLAFVVVGAATSITRVTAQLKVTRT